MVDNIVHVVSKVGLKMPGEHRAPKTQVYLLAHNRTRGTSATFLASFMKRLVSEELKRQVDQDGMKQQFSKRGWSLRPIRVNAFSAPSLCTLTKPDCRFS